MSDKIQSVYDCTDHDDCHVIYYNSHGGIGRPQPGDWESHAPSHTHPECRIGDVVSTIIDNRAGAKGATIEGRDQCQDCQGYFHGSSL